MTVKKQKRCRITEKIFKQFPELRVFQSKAFKVVENKSKISKIENRLFVCSKDIVVYKKVVVNLDTFRNGIAKLSIPAGTLCYRSDFFDIYKCRAAEAKVISISCLDKRTKVKEAYSIHKTTFKYKVGVTIKPFSKFATANIPCASGIHFFLTEKEARNYFN